MYRRDSLLPIIVEVGRFIASPLCSFKTIFSFVWWKNHRDWNPQDWLTHGAIVSCIFKRSGLLCHKAQVTVCFIGFIKKSKESKKACIHVWMMLLLTIIRKYTHSMAKKSFPMQWLDTVESYAWQHLRCVKSWFTALPDFARRRQYRSTQV